MPKTAFRVAPPPTVRPESRPSARAAQASIFGASAVPLPERDPDPTLRRDFGAQADPTPALPFEPPLAPAPVHRSAPSGSRALPQSSPPIPRPRPIPDGPVSLAGPARARRDRPPILALTVASLAGGIGLAALFLLLGRAAQPLEAPQGAPAPPPPGAIASLEVGQVISPIVPGLRGPVAAEDAEAASAQAAPAMPLITAPQAVASAAPAPRPAPVTSAAAPASRPSSAQASRSAPQPASTATAALPRLTGPMSDEPFLTVTTRRIAPPAAQPSPAAAQALADAPFVSPRRPAVPLVPYVRPPAPSADEPISTTPFGDTR